MNDNLKEYISNIFKEEREKKQISIEEVSMDTKISLDDLKMLENGIFTYSDKAFVKNHIKSYAEYLGFEGNKFVELFSNNIEYSNKTMTQSVDLDKLRETQEIQISHKTQSIRLSREKAKKRTKFIMYIFVVLSIIITLIVAYLTYNYIQDKNKDITLEECIEEGGEGC